MQAALKTPATPDGIRRLRLRLEHVCSFESDIRDAASSQRVSGPVCGHVSGEAWPLTQDAGVRVQERGRLTMGDRTKTVTSLNIYFWGFSDDAITLGHDRDQTGWITPLVIFRSESPDGDEWRTETPHRCGADRYQAQLALLDEAIELIWHVNGPAKDYSITTHYHARPEYEPA